MARKADKFLSNFAAAYLIGGLIFAIVYAIYYRWEFPFSYFSPGFFAVVFTWPFQAIGFINDLLYYGFSEKPPV